MEVLTSWKWGKKIIPEKERLEKRNVARVTELMVLDGSADYTKYCKEKTVLVTGDGLTLINDVKEFESWNIPHDIYCCNRSVNFFQRPINHWGAVDAEESAWLSEYYKEDNGRFLRHVIGHCRIGYDVFWAVQNPIDTEFGRRLWIGNSGYFGMLCCIHMGYEKIILAGMPLDRNRHWYAAEGDEGPTWVPDTYTIWMDYKIEIPDANKVRSLSGYSKFIMGGATKEWTISLVN